MTSPPDVIYLQYYGEDWYTEDEIENPEPVDEVTWCKDRINESDIVYVELTPEREEALSIAGLL